MPTFMHRLSGGSRTKEIEEMSDELCFMTAAELRRHIGRRELSPVEVTRAVLDRAQRLQPELNCFITLCADEALEQARDEN